MYIRKAYKYRLKVSPSIESRLRQIVGCTRFVWNKVLALNLARLERKEPLVWYQEASFWLTLWKKSDDYHFLKDIPAQSLQAKLKDLEKAFKDGFDKNQPLKRLPKFQKKEEHDSYRYPSGVKVESNKVYLPKLGWVRFRKSREHQGKICQATISRQGGHWYISLSCQKEVETPLARQSEGVGIDMGITSFAILSNGERIASIHSFRSLETKLVKAQRALSRKQKGSKNRLKQRLRVSRVHEKIRNVRQDNLHKQTSRLSKSHAIIYLEDLKVRNMSASSKGTLEDPGKNVKAKSGLNKSILDQGWYEFRRQLEYKQSWSGGKVVLVKAAYTSQRCSNCGHVSKENRRSQSEFVCVSCGHRAHADINAAKNIKEAGQALSACGDIRRFVA